MQGSDQASAATLARRQSRSDGKHVFSDPELRSIATAHPLRDPERVATKAASSAPRRPPGSARALDPGRPRSAAALARTVCAVVEYPPPQTDAPPTCRTMARLLPSSKHHLFRGHTDETSNSDDPARRPSRRGLQQTGSVDRLHDGGPARRRGRRRDRGPRGIALAPALQGTPCRGPGALRRRQEGGGRVDAAPLRGRRRARDHRSRMRPPKRTRRRQRWKQSTRSVRQTE